MPKHLIFLVHGMGRYGTMADGKYKPDTTGWFEDAEAALKAVYDRFIKDTVGGGAAFDAKFAIKRILYDNLFETFRDGWEQQAADWNKLGVGGGFVTAIEKFFAGNKDDAFVWSHLADAALYMAPTPRAHVRVQAGEIIFRELATMAKAGTLDRWSVIAHSLGTAVAHDVLTDIRDLARRDPVLDAAWTPPRVVCMAANVARLLTDDAPRLYGDTLAPIGPEHPHAYLNCRHRLDPFMALLPFAPTIGGWTAAPRYANISGLDEYYLVQEVIEWTKDPADFGKFAEIVPHGFAHYMHQPRVAAELWPRLLGEIPGDWPDLHDQVAAGYAADRRDGVKTAVDAKLGGALGGLGGGATLTQLFDLLKAVL